MSEKETLDSEEVEQTEAEETQELEASEENTGKEAKASEDDSTERVEESEELEASEDNSTEEVEESEELEASEDNSTEEVEEPGDEAQESTPEAPVEKKGLMQRRPSYSQSSVPNAHRGYSENPPIIMLLIISVFILVSIIFATASIVN